MSVEEILNQIQARVLYQAVQAIEKLGASEDLTKASGAVLEIARKYGNNIGAWDNPEQLLNKAIVETRINEVQRIPSMELTPYKSSRVAQLKLELGEDNG